MTGIKESSEFLDAGAKIMNDVCDAKENDGSISVIEEFKIALQDSPDAVKAGLGAGQIPGELLDLDQSEIEIIMPKVVSFGNAAVRLFALLSK